MVKVLVKIHAVPHAQPVGENTPGAVSMEVMLDNIPNRGSKISLSPEQDILGVVEDIIHKPFFSSEQKPVVELLVDSGFVSIRALRDALIPMGWVSQKDKEEPDTIEVRNYDLEKAVPAIEELWEKEAFFKSLGDPAVRIITLGKRSAKVVIVARPLKRELKQTDISISSAEDMSSFVEGLILLGPDTSEPLVMFISSDSDDVKRELHMLQWTIFPYIGRH